MKLDHCRHLDTWEQGVVKLNIIWSLLAKILWRLGWVLMLEEGDRDGWLHLLLTIHHAMECCAMVLRKYLIILWLVQHPSYPAPGTRDNIDVENTGIIRYWPITQPVLQMVSWCVPWPGVITWPAAGPTLVPTIIIGLLSSYQLIVRLFLQQDYPSDL